MIDRRDLLKLLGFAAGGALVGSHIDVPAIKHLLDPVTDTRARGQGTSCSGSDKLVIDYDNYESPDEVYDLQLGTYQRHRFVSSPTKTGDTSLEIPLLEDMAHAGSELIDVGASQHNLDTNQHGMVEELYASIWIYIPEDFQLPYPTTLRPLVSAMSHSAGDANSGGGMPDGTNGWSTAPYLTRRDAEDGSDSSAPSNGWHVGEYVYHIDQSSSVAGDSVEYGNVVVEPGWTRLETYVKVNTWDGNTANADGISKCWINGEIAYENKNWRFTTSEANMIESNGPKSYYWPGGKGSPRDQTIYFDDHRIVIGPVPENRDFDTGSGDSGSGGPDSC